MRLRAEPVVQRDQLARLVGALNHACDRVGDQPVALAGAREHLEQEQRHVAQVEDLARLDGERGQHLRRDPHGVGDDAVGDRLAVLVELVLPQQAGQDRAAQPLLSRERSDGRCALLRTSGLGTMCVESHGCSPDAVSGILLGAMLRQTEPSKGRVRNVKRSATELSGGGPRVGFEPTTSRFEGEVTALCSVGSGWRMVRCNVFSFAESHALMTFVTQLGLLKRAAWQVAGSVRGGCPGRFFRTK